VLLTSASSLCAAVQFNPAALHEPYFQYLWEIPILELLVNIFTKIGQSKRAAFLVLSLSLFA
jgi:hypothetical protein